MSQWRLPLHSAHLRFAPVMHTRKNTEEGRPVHVRDGRLGKGSTKDEYGTSTGPVQD